MKRNKQTISFHGRDYSLESGWMARQADGSVIARYGDSLVLATATAAKDKAWTSRDYLPLTVDYVERHLAAGKIPGGFFKREGKPSEREVLTSRLIDRPLRPLFPDEFSSETQVVATVLSMDHVCDTDVLSITAASAALYISDIPFTTPIAAVRAGLLGGRWVINPAVEDYNRLEANIVVAASREAIVMVEGGCLQISEEQLIDGLFTALEGVQPLIQMQEDLRRELGKPKRAVPEIPMLSQMRNAGRELLVPGLRQALTFREKLPRRDAVQQAVSEAAEQIFARPEFEGKEAVWKMVSEEVLREEMRQMIVGQRRRVDGRDMTAVRPIAIEVGVLPRTHGSALFTRGETQALVTTTLGTRDDEQKIDTASEERYKTFMLHYNFPPYSVNEVKFLRGPGRREIGHGALAERAIASMLPEHGDFPYTVRVVSDIMESNGSSSMATVCGASLTLMDAGVPIKGPVAGVAMGLVKEGEKIAVLTDILGDEDHIGDMDFKVAGTAEGINAIQMDIKCTGVTREVLQQALEQARAGRLHILEKMNAVLDQPRSELSPYAPRITSFVINPDKIKDVIGPGGKHIRGIVEATGVKIDVEDDGTVTIASVDSTMAEKAEKMVRELIAEPEIGKIYEGVVERIAEYGAFVEILPKVVGLCHISQLDTSRVEKVEDVCKVGDTVKVKVLELEQGGRIRLSRKAALSGIEGVTEEELNDGDGGGRRERGGRGGRERGGRGRR